MKAKLEFTTDYDLFELHELNRNLHADPILEQSLKTHGFMPSCPIQCIRNGNGKLKIISGHHRFYIAKRLRLGVYYVIDNSNCDLFDREGSSKQYWQAYDFATGYAKTGNKDYISLLKFMKKYGLPLGAAASLLGGQSAGSSNKLKDVRRGTFKLGDMTHANEVISARELCREYDINFASTTSFTIALSMVLRIPEFSKDRFIAQVVKYPSLMHKRGRVDEYLDEIDNLYNFRQKSFRLQIKYNAQKIARERQKTFGGHSNSKK